MSDGKRGIKDMARLIDADALKIDFYDEYETEDDAYAYGYVSKHQIDMAPTIDAVSVVRCKECIWWINNLTEFSADEDFLQCRWNEEESPNADDFCSYGERKESE